MKTKVFVLLLILVVGLFGVLLSSMMPYHFYRTTLHDGVQSEYLNLKKPEDGILQSGNEVLKKEYKNIFENQNLWKIFHFKNYVLPLPTHHPQIVLVPKLQVQGKSTKIGASFLERSGQELISFIEIEPFSFKLHLDKEKIFSLPVVKNDILRKNVKMIWRDLFVKELGLDGPEISQEGVSWWNTSIKELLYRLFILHMRELLFTKYGPEHLRFIENKDFGVLRYSDIDERFVNENIYIYREGVVFGIKLRFQPNVPRAKTLRDRFLQTLTYKKSTHDAALKIYAEYRNFPYYKRIRQEGFAYLYAGWSHATEKSDFLKEMINFLERGSNNVAQLTPLYQYGFKKYGTSFSGKNENLKNYETAAEKLKRQTAQETSQELENLEKDKTVTQEGEFSSSEERMLYYLEQAKREKLNSDNEDKMLER